MPQHASAASALAKLEQQVATLQSKNEALTKRLAQLESEPDPDKAPYRGTSVVVATPDAEQPSALKVAQKRDEDDQTAALRRMAEHHPDPEMRRRASDALARRGVRS